MTKFYCDICGEEIRDKSFASALQVTEMKEVYDITSKNLNPRQQSMNSQFQFCKACYDNNIVKLLKV